jgi:hypothetical protein
VHINFHQKMGFLFSQITCVMLEVFVIPTC